MTPETTTTATINWDSRESQIIRVGPRGVENTPEQKAAVAATRREAKRRGLRVHINSLDNAFMVCILGEIKKAAPCTAIVAADNDHAQAATAALNMTARLAPEFLAHNIVPEACRWTMDRTSLVTCAEVLTGEAVTEALRRQDDERIMGEPGVPTPEMLAEADRLEADAKRHRQSREESFQRCDTDGFLSQWADGINARLDERRASLLRAGGKSTFPGLYHGTRRVNAKLIERPSFKGWGTDLVWLLADTEATRYGRRFIPHGNSSKVQRSLGLRERQEWAEARAEIMGGGRGLSGCASAFVGVERTDTWYWDSRK